MELAAWPAAAIHSPTSRARRLLAEPLPLSALSNKPGLRFRAASQRGWVCFSRFPVVESKLINQGRHLPSACSISMVFGLGKWGWAWGRSSFPAKYKHPLQTQWASKPYGKTQPLSSPPWAVGKTYSASWGKVCGSTGRWQWAQKLPHPQEYAAQ